MKRIVLLVFFITIVAGAVMGQTIDLQLAVTTQALTQNMLEQLNLTESEIQNILKLQEQFRLLKEQNNLEMNVVKARIAQELYKPDANNAEVARLLEQASELRLEQELAQVETYQEIRKEMKEENWSKLMQQIRTKTQQRQQAQTNTRTDTQSSHQNGSNSGSGSSSQSRSSSNR